MTALIKYYLQGYLRSFNYLPPLTLALTMIGINYTVKPNPVVESYAVTATMLYFIAGWITFSVLNGEDEMQRDITLVHSRNASKVYLSQIAVAMLIMVAMVIVALFYPIAAKVFGDAVTPVKLGIGLWGHITMISIGVAVAAILSQQITRNPSLSWGSLAFFLILGLLGKPEQAYTWLFPPVSLVIRTMLGDGLWAGIVWPPLFVILVLWAYIRIRKQRIR